MNELLVHYYPILVGSFLFLLGACFGSFAGLIVYRMNYGFSIVAPRSYCESCKKQLKFYHTFPIISWLALGGKCSYCRAPIGVRPLIIELICALAIAGLYVKYGLSLAMIERFIFIFLLVSLAYIDLETFFLPISLLLSLAFTGVIFSLIYIFYPSSYISIGYPPGILEFMVFKADFTMLLNRILGAVLGFVFLALVNLLATTLLRRSGRLTPTQWAMGFGDAFLLGAIGIFVGISHLVLVIFLGAALGSLVGLLGRCFAKASQDEAIPKDAIPFGPFLAIAAIYVYLV